MMRPAKDLDAIIAATIVQSAGTCPFTIVAYSPEEEAEIRARLRGKHGSKHITVRLGYEADEVLP